MALLTPMSLTEARTLASRFGIDLARLEPLAAGSVNSNFRFWTDEGTGYFARIYEEQGFDGAATEVRLLVALRDAGAPVVPPLPSATGERVERFGDKPFAVFPWVAGDWLCLRRVTAEHCRELGGALARVHLASDRVGSLPAGRFRPEDMLARLERIDASGRPELEAAIERIRGAYARYLPARRALPLGVCHGDLFRDNVLWSSGAIAALLDFESASWGPFAYDLMVTALAWCFTDSFVVPHVRALFEGYVAVRALEPAEIAALPVEGALACLRFATSRITDFELRSTPERPPARDYRRFFRRLEALESGALEPALDSLGR